jgi:opacity protein-like surface antigen
MRTTLLALCLALPLASCVSQPRSTITLLGGARGIDEKALEPVDEHIMFGVEFDTYSTQHGWGWEAGLQGSYDEQTVGPTTVESAMGEAYFGARKTFGLKEGSRFHPYLGAGVSAVSLAVQEPGVVDSSDGAPAVYARAGLRIDITRRFSIGADLKGLWADDVTIQGTQYSPNYGQLAITFGFAF